MGGHRLVLVLYSALMGFIFWRVGVWVLVGGGVNYFSNLNDSSVYIFYGLFTLSIFYSVYIFFLVVRLKRKGFLLAASWNIFLGLFILVVWLGGYVLLNNKYEADVAINILSADSVKKGLLSVALIILGLFFRKRASITT